MLRLVARRAYEQGRADQRAADVDFLYRQGDLHRGNPGDAKRRGALRYAADQIRDGHAVGRPPEQVQTELEWEPKPLGWLYSADRRVAE